MIMKIDHQGRLCLGLQHTDMTLLDLLRLLLLSWVIVTTLLVSQIHFVNTLNVDDEITGTKTRFQLCRNTFLKPSICSKNGDTYDARFKSLNSIYRLVKLDGVQVGHVREMNLSEDHTTHRVLTRSLHPLLFEIPDFLSRKECDNLIQLTQTHHLRDSETVYGRGEGAERIELEKRMSGRNLTFEITGLCMRIQRPFYDSDDDGKMSLQEFILFIDDEKHVYPTSEDALPIFRLLDFDLDGFISLEECLNLTKSGYLEFLYHTEELKLDPRHFIRFSETATLPLQEPLVKSLRDRITKLTGLHKTLIEKSEPIQVSDNLCNSLVSYWLTYRPVSSANSEWVTNRKHGDMQIEGEKEISLRASVCFLSPVPTSTENEERQEALTRDRDT